MLKIRKIRNKNKYKIFNSKTLQIIKICDSRQMAYDELQKIKKNRKVNFSNDIVVIHIKDVKKLKKNKTII